MKCEQGLLLGIENTLALEDLDDDWNSRVDRVRDNKNEGLGRVCCDAGGKITNDTSVDLDRGVNVSQSLERVVRM